MPMRRLLPWTIALSFALHGVAYASLGAPQRSTPASARKTQLRFEVVQKQQPKPAPPAPPPEPPKPKPAMRPEPQPAPPSTPPDMLPEPEPVPASDGVTLAGDGNGNGFSMPLGTGGDLSPTRAPTLPPRSAPPPAASTPARARADPPLVAVGDLSSRPSPPQLGAALERNYPPDARRRGLSGSAKVRARIDPDGVVRQVVLVEESAGGFGSACSRTLSGSRWAAPKDKAGRSVATEIRYTCRFVVQP